MYPPPINSRPIATAIGISNPPTVITQPSIVVRPIETPASRSRITLCRYSGRWSLYFDTRSVDHQPVAHQTFFDDPLRQRRHAHAVGTTLAGTLLASGRYHDVFGRLHVQPLTLLVADYNRIFTARFAYALLTTGAVAWVCLSRIRSALVCSPGRYRQSPAPRVAD